MNDKVYDNIIYVSEKFIDIEDQGFVPSVTHWQPLPPTP